MLVSFENSTHTVHLVKIAYCLCPLPSLFYLPKSVELHENITRRHDLAISLLRCRKGSIVHWNAVSLLFNKLALLKVKTLQAVRQSVRAMLL
jgi:hypothetical protein